MKGLYRLVNTKGEAIDHSQSFKGIVQQL